MKNLKFACICATVMVVASIYTYAVVNINKNNVDYKILLEENNQINLLQEKDCIKHNEIEYCDSFKSNWKCREIKSLMMDFAEKDKNDNNHRSSTYINNHQRMVDKYNEECLSDSNM